MDAALWGTMIGGFLGFLASVLPRAAELFEGHLRHKQDHAMEAQRIEAARNSVAPAPPPPPIPPPAPVVPCVPAPTPAPPQTDCAPPVFMNPGVEGEVVAPTAEVATQERDDSINTDTADSDVATDIGAPECSLWLSAFNTLRVSVRPVVTYGFFLLFVVIKLQGLWHGMYVDHVPVIQLLPVIWDDGAESMFAAVLSFWFGSRAFEKSKALTGKAQ